MLKAIFCNEFGLLRNNSVMMKAKISRGINAMLFGEIIPSAAIAGMKNTIDPTMYPISCCGETLLLLARRKNSNRPATIRIYIMATNASGCKISEPMIRATKIIPVIVLVYRFCTD